MVCEPLMMACGCHRAASLHLYEQLVTDRRCGSGERSVNMRCQPIARRRTLNERRLTRRQVGELIASGAQPRPDLTAALAEAVLQSRVYELPAIALCWCSARHRD